MYPSSFFLASVFSLELKEHRPGGGGPKKGVWGCSSIASPICQEGQSERNFPIFDFSSRFFLFFVIFPEFFLIFPDFWHFFAVRGGTLPPLPPQWLRHCGDVGPWRPLFTPLLQFARVPFQAKESVHKTPFWENLEILASIASVFSQILALKPPNLDIFSSQAPKFGNFQFTSPQFGKFSVHKNFSEANISSQAPHLGNPGRTPL